MLHMAGIYVPHIYTSFLPKYIYSNIWASKHIDKKILEYPNRILKEKKQNKIKLFGYWNLDTTTLVGIDDNRLGKKLVISLLPIIILPWSHTL